MSNGVVRLSKKEGAPKRPLDEKACVEAIREGASLRSAAARAGISRDTLMRRLKDPEFSAFALKCEEAWADLERRELEAMKQAKGAEWQRHAWRLERMRPLEWSLTPARLEVLAKEAIAEHATDVRPLLEDEIRRDTINEYRLLLIQRGVKLPDDEHAVTKARKG